MTNAIRWPGLVRPLRGRTYPACFPGALPPATILCPCGAALRVGERGCRLVAFPVLCPCGVALRSRR